jgi:hypothetical protein
MPARHAQQPDGPTRRRALLLAGGVGLAVLLAGGVIWATSSPSIRATSTANEAPVSAAAPATPATAGDGDLDAGDPDTPPAALVACATSLQSGTAVVQSAEASRDHWGSHVRAQLDYDAQQITGPQMVEIFAATKAASPADLAAFDAARGQFEPISGACTSLNTSGMSARWQQVAGLCGQRAIELGKAVQASDAVVADWRAHVQMMQNKPHTDRTDYGRMWRAMITAAPTNLNAFTAARDALNQQPPCSATAS